MEPGTKRMLESDSRLRPRARELRNNSTKQENRLWYDFLKQQPVQWYRQKVIGEFIVDFYCPKAKLVVELDGMQHSLPDHQAYDAERSAYLEALGFKVLRFQNREVDNMFNSVCKRILEITALRLQAPRLPPVEGAVATGDRGRLRGATIPHSEF